MTDPDLRDELEAAIAMRAATREALAIAQGAAARGAELVASLEDELAAVRERGWVATVRRSEELVEWASSDAPLPAGRDSRLVDSAAEIRVSGELNAALAAHVDLLRTVKAAEGALAEAEGQVTAAAVDILAVEAEALSAELVVARRVCWLIEDRLQGLAQAWRPAAPGGNPSPIRLPDQVYDALKMTRPQLQGDVTPPISHNSELWGEYLVRLIADPHAQFVPRDPAPRPIPVYALPRVAFRAQGDVEAERLAEKRATEAQAQAAAPLPGVAASALELARARGQLPDQQP